MSRDVALIPILSDNYAYLVIDRAAGVAAVVDPGDVEPVLAALEREGVKLAAIWATHHHGDHIAGIEPLRAQFDVPVYGGARDRGRILGLSHPLAAGDEVRVGGIRARVLELFGHTLGHIAYFVDGDDGEPPALFCGDALFAGGCGRLFEGTAAQLSHSLSDVLGVLPGDTRVYCGHEYTLANLKFALTVEPGNAALRQRFEQVSRLRAASRPAIASTLGAERATNPFLRCETPEVIATARRHNRKASSRAEVFAAIRALKDQFRG